MLKQRWNSLRVFSTVQWPDRLGTTHGVEHWDRVARFGLLIAEEDVDIDVVMAFAYLHDVMRRDDAYDIEHGLRATKLIDVIRSSLLNNLNDEQIAILKKACELHTTEHRTGNKTIDTCFDADRMDLLRVGITPTPERMATKRGAELVSDSDFFDYYRQFVNTGEF